ncbi:hypothetical protein M3193_05175 [Sporosarcina luteola]|uniref:hypothetical protein n=1 Tax=Sporosarcina luteola TaxID=582850 RepID=UPI00203CD5A5|nr:hypothetical protein [Sporosarcina luteola]MCM3743525.1 hypothetical protein [Sporosarcina luteola]
MSNIVKGNLLMLISSIGFVGMPLFVKLSGDLPVIQNISAIIAFILVIYYKGSLFGKRENQLVLLGRSILAL